MKTILFTIIFSLVFLPAFAQKPTHQIGLTTSLIEDYKSYNIAEYYLRDISTNILYGVQYKAHYKAFSLRSSIGVAHNSINYISPEGNTYQSTEKGYRNALEGTLGIEKRLGSKKLRPYFAEEVFFTQGNKKVDYNFSGCFGSGAGLANIKSQTFGLSSILGVQYQINKYLGLHFEVALRFSQTRIDNGRGYSGGYNSFGLNPVQNFGINYTFKK
ncbi:MAG: hypothetical protein CFE21_15070 [Bacteroidetes bacterium B1(2017)]|nr:MAG: hypothetical protein CFE21_15070 [Bacteroidetes bacterium B1(2017)]